MAPLDYYSATNQLSVLGSMRTGEGTAAESNRENNAAQCGTITRCFVSLETMSAEHDRRRPSPRRGKKAPAAIEFRALRIRSRSREKRERTGAAKTVEVEQDALARVCSALLSGGGSRRRREARRPASY